MRTANPFFSHIISSLCEADLGWQSADTSKLNFRFRFSCFPNSLLFLLLVFALARFFTDRCELSSGFVCFSREILLTRLRANNRQIGWVSLRNPSSPIKGIDGYRGAHRARIRATRLPILRAGITLLLEDGEATASLMRPSLDRRSCSRQSSVSVPG
jgi:hypothetical protein